MGGCPISLLGSGNSVILFLIHLWSIVPASLHLKLRILGLSQAENTQTPSQIWHWQSTIQSLLAWFILSVLFASVLGHCSNSVQGNHPDFLSSCHLHLKPPEQVAKVLFINPSVLDPVLCSMKFQLNFCYFCHPVVLVWYFNLSVYWQLLLCEKQIYFNKFISSASVLCDKFINGNIKQGLCLRNSMVITLQSSSFLSRWIVISLSVMTDFSLFHFS